MLFETTNIKTQPRPGSATVQKAPPLRTGVSNVGNRNPPVYNQNMQQSRTVKNAPTVQMKQSALKTSGQVTQRPGRPPQVSTNKLPVSQYKTQARPATNLQKKQIVGWPSQRQVTRQPLSTRTVQRMPTSLRPVQSVAARQKPLQRPSQRIINRNYYPGTRQYITYYRGRPQPVANVSVPSASNVPATQTTVIGWPSRQVYNASSALPPCDCSQCLARQQAPIIRNAPTAQPVRSQMAIPAAPQVAAPQKATCSTCGLRTKGCITLSGFALNSALLELRHKQQLKKLAVTILQRNINGVIATGYTNSSKAEQMVESLGEKRALTVIMELKRQLSKLKPGAHKNIFWKAISKPVAKPNVAGPSGNRRVVICVRQLK